MGIELLKPHLWWLAILFIAAFAVVIRLSYGATGIPASWKRVLIGLRIAVIAIFLVALLQPVFKSTFTREVKPGIAVIVDNSTSMSVRQSPDLPSFFDASMASYKNTAEKNPGFTFSLYGFSESLSAVRDPDSLKPDGSSSEAETALKSLYNSFSAEDLRGILFYSDGQFQMNASMEETLKKISSSRIKLVPVLPVSPGAIQDTAIRFSSDTLTEIYSGQKAELSLELLNKGAARKATITVYEDDKTLFSRQFSFGPGEETIPVRFNYTPQTDGIHRLRAILAGFPEEPFKENNQDTLFIRVNKGRHGILLVSGTLTWEYKFLQRILSGDPGIRLRTITGLRQAGLEELNSRTLDEIDLVILANTPARSLNPAFTSALAKRVRTSGMSLLILGGEDSLMSQQITDPALEGILPFKNGNRLQKLTSPVQITLTKEGELNPVMLIMDDPGLNRLAWEGLPPLNMVNWIEPAKGCMVLAASMKNPQIPVMGISMAGLGKVFFIAGASTWKWAFLNLPVNDDHLKYSSFYRQLIRELTSSRMERMNLYTDKFTYRKGETIRLQAVILDDNFNPPGTDSIEVQISMNGRPAGSMRLKSSRMSPERFTAEFPAADYGDYSANLSWSGRSSAASFLVQKSRDELFNVGYNTGNLRRISALSSTAVLSPDAPLRLDDIFDSSKIVRRMSVRKELWNSWAVIIAITALLTIEWILRKRKGLP